MTQTTNRYRDQVGLECSGAHPDALDAYHRALRAFHCYQGDPVALLAPALEAHPAFAMGRVLHAWLHALSTEPAAPAVVEADCNLLQQLALNARETMHLQALTCFNQGRWQMAGRHLEDLSLQWPRDALALQAGHLIDFLRGDSRMLRDRIGRVLAAWPDAEAGSHAVLGMWAFGLEECGQYDLAERAARRALDLEPADAWAHHAMAHIFEMQGRPADGSRWMRSREAFWNDNHFLAIHNAWHWALFELAQGNTAEALRLYDERVRASRSTLMVDLVDASAMLWRLQFLGVPVGDRWESLADDWTAQAVPGLYAFNDFHAMLAWVGSGRIEQARQWLEAQGSDAAPGDQAALARQVGLPLLESVADRHECRHQEALEKLRRLRPLVWRMGGSHAQRDLVDLLMMDAALDTSDPPLARGLVAERLSARPLDPFGRHARTRLSAMVSAPPQESDLQAAVA